MKCIRNFQINHPLTTKEMNREEFYSQYMNKHMRKYNKLGYSIEWNNRYAETEEREKKARKAYIKTRINQQTK